MKDETRYRVTGSLFLLAVAVICLPMLLDGDGLPARDLPDLPPAETLPALDPPTRPAPESNYAARVERLREQVDADGFMADSGTRFGEPILTEPRGSSDTWAVQVASFSQAGNAEKFRGRLREDGYEAFLSTVRSDEQVLSRVAVGPLLDEARARTLRDELSSRYQVQARLMEFSN